MRRAAVPLLALLMLAPLVPASPSDDGAWWLRPLTPVLPGGAVVDLAYPVPVRAATPAYTLGDDVVVPVPGNQDEFSIAINPRDPNNLVAGANDYCCSAVKAGVFTSFDGGQTWVHGLIPTPNRICGGDPALGAGPDGTFWYIGITGFCGGADSPSTIFASKSTDGGLTWTTLYPIVSPGNSLEDKPWVAVDPATGAVAISWTRFGNADITITISRDGGATWTPWKRLGGGQFSQPVFAPNGDIYVTWNGGGATQFARSTDGGLTWTTHATGLSLGLPPELVNFRYNPTPTMGVVPAGAPDAGRIYLAGPRHPPMPQGGPIIGSDIAVVVSDDRGQTWTAPEALVRPGVQFMPWMAIMPDGTVGIAYMDTVLAPQTYGPLAGNFGPGGVMLSQSLSTKKPGQPWTTTLLTDLPSDDIASTFWGDYQGLAASSLGFHPAFGDARDSLCGCGANNGYPDFATMRVLP